MDLKTFKFPDVTVADAAFPTFDTIPELLKEAISREFHRNYNPYNELFSELFFNGGTVQFKPDVDPEYQNRVWSYCRSFMGSWAPKHQDKAAICAMLMSEILEPELKKE